jgi:POT family proton-dependent oligopeptide transporter
VGWVAIGVGVAVMVLSPLVKRLMHLDTLTDHTVAHDLLGESEVGEAIAVGIHPATRD